MSESKTPICSHCLLPIHKSESGLRHYGTHIAHQESRCIALLRQEIFDRDARIAELEAECNALRAAREKGKI
jgi:hypothetical protein